MHTDEAGGHEDGNLGLTFSRPFIKILGNRHGALMKTRISHNELIEQFEKLADKTTISECHYADLLRILLFPSLYQIDDDSIGIIIQSLRKSESNASAKKLLYYLNVIAPISSS